MGDGYLNKCKECTKQDVKNNYRTRRDRYVQYEKERWPARKAKDQLRKQSPEYKAYKKRWRAENQHKQQAHTAVARALRDGALVRKPCQHCSDPRSKAHHPDYDKPLDVVWLCDDCHRTEHSRLRGIAA